MPFQPSSECNHRSDPLPQVISCSHPPAPVHSGANLPDVQVSAKSKMDLSPADLPEILMHRMQSQDGTETASALKSLAEALGEENENCDQNRTAAFCLGAHTLLVMAMRKFQNREDVQTFGCVCLQMLAYSESHRSTVANLAGGVVAVVIALSVFPDSMWVQHAGYAALMNFFDKLDASDADSEIQEMARHFVYGFDGVPMVIRALTAYPHQENLQVCCCALLYNLSTIKEFQATLKSEGVVSTMAMAYERNPEHPIVKICTMGAVEQLLSA